MNELGFLNGNTVHERFDMSHISVIVAVVVIIAVLVITATIAKKTRADEKEVLNTFKNFSETVDTIKKNINGCLSMIENHFGTELNKFDDGLYSKKDFEKKLADIYEVTDTMDNESSKGILETCSHIKYAIERADKQGKLYCEEAKDYILGEKSIIKNFVMKSHDKQIKSIYTHYEEVKAWSGNEVCRNSLNGH